MTLATRLLLLIALGLTPPLLFGVLNDMTQRNERAAALHRTSIAESRSAQDGLSLITGGAQRLLVALAEAPPIRSADPAACTRYLKAVALRMKEYSLLAASDANGNIICNNEGAVRGSYSVGGRAYFRRALATGQFASGDLVTGFVTHRRSLHFAVPFDGLDDAVAGVVSVSVDQEWLASQLATETVSAGAVIMMLDPSGTIVAAAQDGGSIHADWVGQPAPRSLLDALTVTAPQVVETNSPDGMLRMFGAVPANPALLGNQIVVGVDRERAFADIRAASLRNLLGLAIGGGGALLAGILSARRFVLRPLARIAAAANRVGAGDLNTRTDLGRRSGEFHALGAGFDHMIAALAAREQERDHAEAALRDSEARFQAIANCIDQMVWSTRPDGYHDYFNQRWYEFTGTKPGSIDGESWIGVFHPDDHDETKRIWQASLATGQPYHREYRLRHVSGDYRWVLGRAQAIQDEHGQIVRWYGTCTDIDEFVQAREIQARSREELTREIADRTAELISAEDQLRQAQKMEAVGQLTGGIAHDFNNMLQAIGGSLELLVRRIEQNKLDDAKRFAGVARTTVDRAAALTHRLLSFARRQNLSPEALDPAALVDGMAELVTRTVGPAIEVSTHHGDGTWTVLCDLSQLENVVFNLCINARDAMPAGGKLTITTENVVLHGADVANTEGATAGDYVEIAVADTGAGMDQATRARAFEPFFTTKPIGQGTGLGLSQVYGFVRQSGGFVRLESEPGAGTTVHLHLPRHRATQISSESPNTTDQPASILLIEDDLNVRRSTADHLKAIGYRVRSCATGSEAMFLLGAGLAPLDVLVTEIGLPGNVNGRQIAEAARHRNPDLPVLFITAYTGGATDDELAPGMSIIAKPFTPQALASRVRSMLPASS